jgi:MoaA/NifB/PqqE/SkfB family radical SAM enzyme
MRITDYGKRGIPWTLAQARLGQLPYPHIDVEPIVVTDQRGRVPVKPFVDVIWNITKLCVWNCRMCCVDADYVRKAGDTIEIHTDGLSKTVTIPYERGAGTIYEQALKHQQRIGAELTLEQKLKLLDHLEGFSPRIDFSGGDALAVGDTIVVMEEACRRFGRENITLTVTGAGSHGYSAEQLREVIGEFNFTFDGEPEPGSETRPRAYATGNLRKGEQLAAAGVSTRAELPLTTENMEPAKLREIYLALHEAGISKLLLMRLFAVGRGTSLTHKMPTATEYRQAIEILRDLESAYGGPTLKLQCALRRLDPLFDPNGPNPCDALGTSLGLTAAGTLLISPWAINDRGTPMHRSWVLGNLAKTPLRELLGTDRVERMRARLDENAGECKIFAWQHSTADADAENRFFGRTDPLYGADSDTRR